MITVEEIASAFRSMLGWPYASPGSNDENGVDCSGAFVYAYRLYGQSIYHGSNRMIRRFCHDVRRVNGAAQLRVGMAIFKSRSDLSGMKAEYKPGGRYYDPALPLDYYHVGLVTSVEPLQIINATQPEVLISTRLNGWTDAGYLNAVEYPDTDDGGGSGDDGDDDGDTDGGGESGDVVAYAVAEQGGSVNLRRSPTTGAAILARVPLGRRVRAMAVQNGWRKVRYGAVEGYMMDEFLITACADEGADASLGANGAG